jgi:hypothetical protein
MVVNRGPLPKNKAGTHAGRKSRKNRESLPESVTHESGNPPDFNEPDYGSTSEEPTGKELTLSNKPPKRSVRNGDQISDVQQLVNAGTQANAEVRAMAAFLGISYQQLLMCVLQQVKLISILQCLRSSNSDFMSCIMQNVSLEGLLTCAGAAVTGGNSEGEF